MLIYPGRDLYTKINKIVGKAFYTDYLYSEENWYSIDTILMNYSVSESEEDLPMITVEITFETTSTSAEIIEVDLFLDRSDDFNSGIVLAAFERCEADDNN